MGNHEIHRCKSCDDRWPHKIYQHHFPGHIKNTTLSKKIVGTQLTALSLTDMIYPYLFDPPRFHMDWEPPVGCHDSTWSWAWSIHWKASQVDNASVELDRQLHRGWSVDRHPGEGWKNMGKGKNLKFLEETNQRSIKQLHAMSCRIIVEDVLFSLKCVTICLRKKQ